MNDESTTPLNRRRRWPMLIAVASLTVLIVLLVAVRFVPPPAELGVREGRLAACPDKPNCVCTQADDQMHQMPAIDRAGLDPAEAIQQLSDRIRQMPRTRIVESTNDYLHAEFRTRLGFVDDVEFYAPPDRPVVEFRSASRVGHSDLGVNRERMNAFADALK